MGTPKPKFSARLLVILGLVVAGVAALVVLARYGLHRLADKARNRG